MDKFRFYKEQDNWYVDLPLDQFTKPELEMVQGCDVMLDMLSGYTEEVMMDVSLFPFEGSELMLLLNKGREEGGAYYTVETVGGEKFGATVWLCSVLFSVYGEYPNTLYFKKA